jgi:hypothetical protein
VTFRPYKDEFRTALQYIAQAAWASGVGPYEAFLYASTAATMVLKSFSNSSTVLTMSAHDHGAKASKSGKYVTLDFYAGISRWSGPASGD